MEKGMMNGIRAAIPATAKKLTWNIKYGLFGYPHFDAPEDIVRYLSAHLSEASALLDLGCGRGSLLRALREKGWSGSYCGVDISQIAVDDARKLEDGRSSWVVSDFESFRSQLRWDTIAMVESIYYVKLQELAAFLTCLMSTLNPGGVFVFRVHDLEKHRAYVDVVMGLYPHTKKVDRNLFCISGSRKPNHGQIAQ
jgi:predicted TPR repeat methyltransferase